MPDAASAAFGRSDGSEGDGRRARGAATLGRLLDAASALFRAKGFNGVTLEEIARSAGVSGPAIYRHFQNKAQILEALLVDANDVIFAPLSGNCDDDPTAVLERYFERVVQLAIAHPDSIALYHQEWRSLSSEARTAQAEAMRQQVAAVSRVLRKARPGLTPAEARLRVGVAFGVASHVGYLGVSPNVQGNARAQVLLEMTLGALLGPRWAPSGRGARQQLTP